MSQHSREREGAWGPNPALQHFAVLVGSWSTTGTHGQDMSITLHGHASFEWLENGAFLLMRSRLDDPRFPGAVAIIGSDDAAGECYMLTFDERGVSRKYAVTLHSNIWRWWRDAPGFLQRYEGIIGDGGNTITARGELSRDGVSWEKDLDLTYTRVG